MGFLPCCPGRLLHLSVFVRYIFLIALNEVSSAEYSSVLKHDPLLTCTVLHTKIAHSHHPHSEYITQKKHSRGQTEIEIVGNVSVY